MNMKRNGPRPARRAAARGVAAAGLLLALPGPASATATYPDGLDPTSLSQWLVQETDLRPSQVVAISRSSIAAIVDGPTLQNGSLRVTIRSEAIAPPGVEMDGREILSSQVTVAVDCAGRRTRQGATTGHPGRNLGGTGYIIAVQDPDWRFPSVDTQLDAVWRAVCDPAFAWPLDPHRAIARRRAMPEPVRRRPPRPPAAAHVQARAAPSPPPVPTPAKAPAAKAEPRPVVARAPDAAALDFAIGVRAGAFHTRAEAEARLAQMLARSPRALDGRAAFVASAGGEFVVAISGFADRAEAGATCGLLRDEGLACAVDGERPSAAAPDPAPSPPASGAAPDGARRDDGPPSGDQASRPSAASTPGSA